MDVSVLRTHKGRRVARLVGWAVIGFTGGILLVSLVHVGMAAQASSPQHPEQAPQKAHVFASDAGMVLNFIKPDKTADFEDVMQKLKEALRQSEKPERRQQAQSWKVFRSAEAAQGGNALYVFVIDPAVKGADYTVSNIFAEAYEPAELNELLKKYAAAYASAWETSGSR